MKIWAQFSVWSNYFNFNNLYLICPFRCNFIQGPKLICRSILLSFEVPCQQSTLPCHNSVFRFMVDTLKGLFTVLREKFFFLKSSNGLLLCFYSTELSKCGRILFLIFYIFYYLFDVAETRRGRSLYPSLESRHAFCWLYHISKVR